MKVWEMCTGAAIGLLPFVFFEMNAVMACRKDRQPEEEA
jgi:hypothetical protein